MGYVPLNSMKYRLVLCLRPRLQTFKADRLQLHICLSGTYSMLSYACTLQEFGTDRQPEAPAAAHRRFGVSVSAAHVCAVLALPPPPLSDTPGSNALHGHRYLALDLFPVSGSWQHFKSSCSRTGRSLSCRGFNEEVRCSYDKQCMVEWPLLGHVDMAWQLRSRGHSPLQYPCCAEVGSQLWQRQGCRSRDSAAGRTLQLVCPRQQPGS